MIRYLLPLLLLAGCAADAPSPSAELGAKRIAITYDDAPRGDGRMFLGTERTAQLIASLDAADSGPVTVFVTTRGMDTEEGRARVRAYADAGHIIANHSDTHRSGNSLPVEEYLADIDIAEDKLDGLPNRRPWFRFPFLHEGRDLETRDALRTGLAERGLMSGYVTVDTYDWHMEDRVQQALEAGKSVDMEALEQVYVAMVVDAAEHYDRLSRETLNRRAAHVLLVHENDIGAEFADEMIGGLRSAGWEIIHPDEAFADPIAERLPRTVFAGRGRIAAIALDEGADSPDVFGHWSAHRSAIDARLETADVFGD